MTRLNLSELAKKRLEKSHLRYQYEPSMNAGRIISTYPSYDGGEYVVCIHAPSDVHELKNKIENEFPQFISSVNIFRNVVGNENFKDFSKFYNFETGTTKLIEWNNNRTDGVDTKIELNCGEVSIRDNELNVDVAIKREFENKFKISKLYPFISDDVAEYHEYFKEKKHVEKNINTDNFNIENCSDYKQNYSIDMEGSFILEIDSLDRWRKMNQFERYEFVNDKKNQFSANNIKISEVATYSTKLPIKGLLHTNTDFLNESVDYFNENGKSKEFAVLFDEKNADFSEVKITQMLLDENVFEKEEYEKIKHDSLLQPSEEAFINAINEVNERAQSRIDAKDERLKEDDIDRRFRAMMRKMAYNIAQSEINEQDQGLER